MVGEDVAGFAIGDRVMAYHHIPCGRVLLLPQADLCAVRDLQEGRLHGGVCARGRRVRGVYPGDGLDCGRDGKTAGLVKIPDDIPLEQAAFIEPVNTCFKAVRLLKLQADETVLVIGQGPIGILLAALAQRTGATVLTSDLYAERHAIAAKFGLNRPLDARGDVVAAAKAATEGRGADVVLVAVGADALIGRRWMRCGRADG